MNQGSLFARGAGPRARARRSDPMTSQLAAASVERIRESQRTILELLRCQGPATDPEILARLRRLPGRFQMSESGARTRRSELVARGLARDSGRRARLPSGRMAIVWKAT